jgi:glycosyltransferase involved in cell wall biosynthesis
VRKRLGVVGTVVYPPVMESTAGDVRTWFEVGQYFDDITVIAQTDGWLPRWHRLDNVLYILIPKLPRPLDLPTFPLAAAAVAFAVYGRGVKTWSFSDPLRPGLVCLAMRWLPGVRLVVHLQGQLLQMPSSRFGRATFAVEALSRFVARRADTVRVVSRQVAGEAAAAGVAVDRIVVVPSRCDTELFDPDRWREAGKAVRSSFPGEAGSPVVGFLGSLNASKGLDTLIAAATKLAEKRPIRMAVAGDGPLRRELVRAASTGAAPIAVLGHLPTSDVPGFLAAVDVLAVPSYDEGLPRVVLEAMAMCVPVVASSVGGIPEAVDHERTGLLVRPGDRDALVAALDRLLDDPGLGSKLASAGRRRVLDEFEARSGWRRLAEVHDADSVLRARQRCAP